MNNYENEYIDPLDPENQLGLIIKDRYRLDAILGEGSFAVVFKASSLNFSTSNTAIVSNQVAVKCLYKTGLTQSQIALQKEEVKIMEKVSNHPNITSLLDTFETKDHLYLVMELCDTDLFDAILNTDFHLNAMELFEQLCNAVAYCHDRSVFHRDLKPENVLLTAKGNIRLADFGLATVDALSCDFGCGSVRYMSAECMAGHEDTSPPYSTAANDVWSLAIILINMLTGKNPWIEPCSKDKHFKSHITAKSSLNSIDTFRSQFGFSDGLCQVLRLVFQSEPSTRPSVRQFLKAIQKVPFLFHQSTTTSATSPIQKLSLHVPHHSSAKQSQEIISPNGLITPSSFTELSSRATECGNGTSTFVSVPRTNKNESTLLPPTPDELMNSKTSTVNSGEAWRLSPMMKSFELVFTHQDDLLFEFGSHQDTMFEME